MKILIVPEPKNNVVIKHKFNSYIEVYFSKNILEEELKDILSMFGNVYKDIGDSFSLFVNPVYDLQEVISFIQSINGDN